jgi:Bifunctional DNA primase/polymerase, N-terminal
MSGPYARYARRYLAAGYSPLPLPPRRKASPPRGWTGADAPMASAADVEEWIQAYPDGNIALRLPRGVIGVDFDAHKGDAERQACEQLLAELGPLPAGPCCTARDDGLSGIRLFRVPDDYIPKDLGLAGEVIHHGWRYVVAPPSIHPDGGTYRWT